MELREVVQRRRMVRRFDQRPVPADVVDRVLDLARRAPSAGFAQGVDFVVLDTPSTVAEFWRITKPPDGGITDEELAYGPTVIVLPIADKRAYLERYRRPDKAPFGLGDEDAWPVKFWDVDASMASMLALLAAVDEGLGALFFGIRHGEQALLARLGVPEGIRPVGIIGLGYRAADDAPSGSSQRFERRPLAAQVHRNGW